MDRLTESELRASLINASRGEATSMTPPRDLSGLDWDSLEFLGWRDAKAPLRGYVVRWRDGRPVGLLLRAAESRVKRAAPGMCQLCRSSRPSDLISLFTARRTGPSGRNGNTVGTYICADFTCPTNARTVKASAVLTPDPGKPVEQRARELGERLDGFIDEVGRPPDGEPARA